MREVQAAASPGGHLSAELSKGWRVVSVCSVGPCRPAFSRYFSPKYSPSAETMWVSPGARGCL